MTPVFVDTGAFYALVDRSDANHRASTTALKALAAQERPLVTTTYVVDETLTLVRFRVGHAAAVTLGRRLLATHWCRVADVSDEIRNAAWYMFCRFADQSFSFTDCTSFAFMQTSGISDAFTFDRRDFAAAGLVALPA